MAAAGLYRTRYGWFWFNFLASTGSALTSTATMLFVFKPLNGKSNVGAWLKKTASAALLSLRRARSVPALRMQAVDDTVRSDNGREESSIAGE